MPVRAAIHRSVATHLESFTEVQTLLRHAETPTEVMASLDALCGAIEDIRLDVRRQTDPKHAFVLGVLVAEAEALVTGPGGLPRAWVRPDASGLVVNRKVVMARLAVWPTAVKRRLARFEEAGLAEFLRAWARPAATPRPLKEAALVG